MLAGFRRDHVEKSYHTSERYNKKAWIIASFAAQIETCTTKMKVPGKVHFETPQTTCMVSVQNFEATIVYYYGDKKAFETYGAPLWAHESVPDFLMGDTRFSG